MAGYWSEFFVCHILRFFQLYCNIFNKNKIVLFYQLEFTDLQKCNYLFEKKNCTFCDLHLCSEINYYNIFRYTLWHNLKSFRHLIFIFLLRFLKIIFIIFLAFVGFKKKNCSTIFFQKTTFNMEYLYHCAPLFIEQVRKIG